MSSIRSALFAYFAVGAPLMGTSMRADAATEGIAMAKMAVSIVIRQTCSIQMVPESASPEVNCQFRQPFDTKFSEEDAPARSGAASLVRLSSPGRTDAGKMLWTVMF